MSTRGPGELDRAFLAALNAGDLDALVALYEPEATLTPMPGQVVRGSAAIREALAGFLAMKPTLEGESKLLAETNGVALLTSRWKLAGSESDGSAVEMTGLSVAVLRQQSDGSWLFAIDNPMGLEWDD